MASPAPNVPPSGVWVPAVTMFNPSTDEVNLQAQRMYYSYLSTTGLVGLVVLGTNAETLLLTREERKSLIETARAATPQNFPIMAGVSGHSMRQVCQYIDDAVAAGANYVLVLPAAYFGPATTAAVIERFYDDVASYSPLPVVLYNFPAVSNGVDLDSAIITRLAKRHTNIVGVKLTCGSVAKITRLAAELSPDQFATFGGQSDFLIGGLAVGSAGCIAAFANVFPKSISRVYELWTEGKTDEALVLHRRLALAEQTCKTGIAAIKYAAALTSARKAGVQGSEELLRPRRPYIEASDQVKAAVAAMVHGFLEVEDPILA